MDYRQRNFFKIREKDIQKGICSYLHAKKCITIDCDVMFALSYMGSNQNLRFAFISEKKSKGWTKGQPDLIVITPSGKVIFAELKTNKGGVISPEQKQFQKLCEEHNLNYTIWRSIDDCIEYMDNVTKNVIK